MSRSAEIDRKTGETAVHVSLALDGTGAGRRETGVGDGGATQCQKLQVRQLLEFRQPGVGHRAQFRQDRDQ